MNKITSVTNNKQPNYINYGGDYKVEPPFTVEHSSMYGFGFQSNYKKLQHILTTRLNFANHGRQYLPFSSTILITFVNAPYAHTGKYHDNNMFEAVFWVLCVEQVKRNGRWESQRLVWFIPYIFVSNLSQFYSGREIMGYPKVLAEIKMPSHPKYANNFEVITDSYATYHPSSICAPHSVFHIQNTSKNPHTHPTKEIRDTRQAMLELMGFLPKLDINTKAVRNWWDGVRLTRSFFSKNARQLKMPAIFFKQFRSASNNNKACYQALVESAFVMQEFHRFELLKGSNYSMTINHLDSFPLAKDFGFYTKQKAKYAFHAEISFENTAGREIWEARSTKAQTVKSRIPEVA